MLLKLSAKFEFSAKTENPILTLKKALESKNTKKKLKRKLKLAKNESEPFIGCQNQEIVS